MIENNIKELRTEFSKPFITHAQKFKQGYLMYPIRRMPEKSFSNTQKINMEKDEEFLRWLQFIIILKCSVGPNRKS